jgi:hypothetical protein
VNCTELEKSAFSEPHVRDGKEEKKNFFTPARFEPK